MDIPEFMAVRPVNSSVKFSRLRTPVSQALAVLTQVSIKTAQESTYLIGCTVAGYLSQIWQCA
jgi:hypothetical protein